MAQALVLAAPGLVPTLVFMRTLSVAIAFGTTMGMKDTWGRALSLPHGFCLAC